MQVEDFRQKMIQRAENFSWDIKKVAKCFRGNGLVSV